jgi:hypothetical protein
MSKRFKQHFDFVRIELHEWRFVCVHYVGTKSTYKFGWKKKKAIPEVEQFNFKEITK